jgi:Tfp pilus assembly protein PilN
MIEINLVPDVKQELIKAQRVRVSVISIAILTGLIAAGVVVLLAIWVFGVQTARSVILDNTIQSESETLASVEDVNTTLTIQNQLSKISEMHNNKTITSRIFDVLTAINPSEPNNVAITNLSLDIATSTIMIEAQAANGYPALEAFKKTIAATTLRYNQDGEQFSVPLASNVSDSERSYGEDASGARVLRFTLSFTYPEELFSRMAENATIVSPERTNATDSFQGVPHSLFTQRANDTTEEEN